MKLRGVMKEKDACRVANRTNRTGKDFFSSIFMPEYLETSIILLNTHTHTASRVNYTKPSDLQALANSSFPLLGPAFPLYLIIYPSALCMIRGEAERHIPLPIPVGRFKPCQTL